MRLDDVRERLDPDGPERPPGSSEPDVSRAGTVARAPGAALVAAPTPQGGVCIVPLPESAPRSHGCFSARAAKHDAFLSWRSPDDEGWYLLGRLTVPDAARIALFEKVTHPFEETGPEKLAGTPLVADVGPGGFFLVRVPDELRPGLDLAYGEVAVLDETGDVISRACRFLGKSASSPGAYGIAQSGDPLARSLDRAGTYPCPETGSAVEEATMHLVPPRSGNLADVRGQDVLRGGTVPLSRFAGRPTLIAVVDPSFPTTARLLRELDVFGRRHQEVNVVWIFHRPDAVEEARYAARRLDLELPILVQRPVPHDPTSMTLLRDANGRFGPHIVAIDGRGRIAAELAAPTRLGDLYALVTRHALAQAVAAARSG